MNKLWYLFGIVFILGGLFLWGWLSIYVMLYGGIMSAVNAWGVCNSTVVWGIIRAVFFELGLIPGVFVMTIGKAMLVYGAAQTASKRLYSRFGRLGRR